MRYVLWEDNEKGTIVLPHSQSTAPLEGFVRFFPRRVSRIDLPEDLDDPQMAYSLQSVSKL